MGNRCDAEHTETDRNRLDPLAGTDDRAIDEPVRVAVIMALVTVVMVVVVGNRLRRPREDEVAVDASCRVAVDVLSVPVQDADARVAHDD